MRAYLITYMCSTLCLPAHSPPLPPFPAPAIAAELEECCWFINLLSDDCWQPWALEFFYQSSDDAKRAAFIKGAELLQLYCELKQDQAFKQERCVRYGVYQICDTSD